MKKPQISSLNLYLNQINVLVLHLLGRMQKRQEDVYDVNFPATNKKSIYMYIDNHATHMHAKSESKIDSDLHIISIYNI